MALQHEWAKAREFINISPIARNSNSPILLTLILVKKPSFLFYKGKSSSFELVHNNKISFPQYRVFGADLWTSTKLALGRCWAVCDSVPNLACQMCGVMSEKNCHKSLWRAEGEGISRARTQWCRLMYGFIKAQFVAWQTSVLAHSLTSSAVFNTRSFLLAILLVQKCWT